VFEENSGRNAIGVGEWHPYLPEAKTVVGDSDDVAFGAVLCK